MMYIDEEEDEDKTENTSENVCESIVATTSSTTTTTTVTNSDIRTTTINKEPAWYRCLVPAETQRLLRYLSQTLPNGAQLLNEAAIQVNLVSASVTEEETIQLHRMDHVPHALWNRVATYLTVPDTMNFVVVCRTWYNIYYRQNQQLLLSSYRIIRSPHKTDDNDQRSVDSLYPFEEPEQTHKLTMQPNTTSFTRVVIIEEGFFFVDSIQPFECKYVQWLLITSHF